MELLERDLPAAWIDEAFTRASGGEGSVVLVGGEAGIGKTTFVQAYTQVRSKHARVLLGAYCLPDIHSRLLTPGRFVTHDSASDLVAKFDQWFGKSSDITVEHSRVDLVGERLSIFYRFRLYEQEEWFVVEQPLYCTMQDGRIARLDLLCSGFQPVEQGETATSLTSRKVGEQQTDSPALLEIYTGAAGSESTCAVLTPAIKMKLREMESGQVLEVRVDDTSARGDIEAWCRLSGNQLVNVSESSLQNKGQVLNFFVRKK